MQIDPALHSQADNYKILTNVVVPRPIAWVTSLGNSGVVNLAPFSFFNAVGSDPLYIIVSVGMRDDGSPKDTARNIRACGEFIVNLVTEPLLRAMNISAVDFPPDESEVAAAGLKTVPGVRVRVPRLADAQVSLECRLQQSHPLGTNTLFVGEVLMFHVADELLGPRLRINGFAPVGRLGSPSMYCRTTDRFDLPRMTYAEWQELEARRNAAAAGVNIPT
jgi:flavin reductase (DIM6/NTAB) family NADH-FMN oxidoreductase RutF